MPRASDSTTDTYLDVLRTLGVTDAALRRHHDAAPETPLRVAIDGDRGAPTADLLSALGATGRVLDLRDGLAADDGERLTAALGRFGFAVECSPVADADESEDLALRVRDAVTGDVASLHAAPDAAAVETTLREDLLAPLDVELAELLDGRHLVAEARELRALADRYGERIEPFDDPLLVPRAAVDVDAEEPAAGIASAESGGPPSVGAMWGADASAGGTPSADPSESAEAPPEDAPAADDGESFGEALAGADDATTDSIEAALSEGGPSTHTIESDDDLAAASETTVGGGPRRTVSTTGIDEVFDQLESSTADAESTQDAHESTAPQPSKTTMADASDPPTKTSASSDDAGGTAEGLSGGPKRTVSTTSADDILARATGERDFETIAAEEGDADPDAVLAEGEVPPALEDSDVTPSSSEAPDVDPDGPESAPPATSHGDSGPDEVDVAEVAGATEESASATEESAGAAEESAGAAEESAGAAEESAGATEGSASAAEESAGAAEESAGAADRPPADPAPPASTARSDESSPYAADGPTADELVAAAGASGSADAAAVADDDPDPMPPDEADAATTDEDSPAPGSSTEESDREERASSDDATATPEPADLGDDLIEDVELREGSASVDEPAAPATDAVETDAEPAAADGPLAARGGLRPDDDSEPDPADDTATGDPRSTDATGGPTSDASTTGAPEADESTTERRSPAAEEEPASDAVAEDESTDDGDAGLVGRITSTIFGR